ncbi:hypothetical protein JCM21900_002226 [Sporobolomyces salmonicolor]
MSDDPASTFFPDVDEVPSLYSVLDVPPTATAEDLKKAYRRLSLLYHPDKVASVASSSSSSSASASASDLAAATLRFQQIGFAYSVLKDAARRERYDATGRTAAGGSGDGARTEAEWRDYFRALWTGEVSAASLDDFAQRYQGSDEETADVLAAYRSSAGDLDVILATVMCSTVADEDRFVALIDAAISSGALEATRTWKRHRKDAQAKERRKRKAEKEAREAEKLAKELGVHEELFGDATGKGKGKGRGKGKGKGKENPDDDEAALKALIQGNQAKRMSSLMDSLEAKYGGGSSSKKNQGKKRRSTGGAEDDDGEDHDGDDDVVDEGGKRQKKQKTQVAEPTEEEFAAIQARLDARRAAAPDGSSSARSGKKTRGKSK